MTPKPDHGRIRALGLVVGSIGSALIGSLCLFGPLVFTGVGTAGLTASLAEGSRALIPFEPVFWLLAVAGLVQGWRRFHRSPASDRRRLGRVWTVTTVVVAILGLFWIAAQAADLETAEIKIEGLQSRSCAKIVREALTATDGVIEVEIKRKWFATKGEAIVRIDPRRVTADDLVHAVEAAGTPLTPYTVTMVSRR